MIYLHNVPLNKACKIVTTAYFEPPQGIEPQCYSTTAKCPTIERREYSGGLILLALLIPPKGNSCTQPTRRFKAPQTRIPTTQSVA